MAQLSSLYGGIRKSRMGRNKWHSSTKGGQREQDVYRQLVANQSGRHMTSESLAHAFSSVFLFLCVCVVWLPVKNKKKNLKGGGGSYETKVSYFGGGQLRKKKENSSFKRHRCRIFPFVTYFCRQIFPLLILFTFNEMEKKLPL